MKYMILIYNNPDVIFSMSQEQQGKEIEAYMAFNAEAGQRGVLRDSNQLQLPSNTTTVRVRDGKTVATDGPFAETKEFLGGYYILDCANLDEAIEMAAKIPTAKHGVLEVRPIFEFSQ